MNELKTSCAFGTSIAKAIEATRGGQQQGFGVQQYPQRLAVRIQGTAEI